MADQYSDRLGLIAQEEGTHSNEWGDLLNLNLQRLDSATRGYIKIALSGAQSLDSNDITTTTSIAQEESFFKFIEFTGTGGTVTVPAENIIWTVYNNTGGDFTFQPAGGTGVTLTNGKVQTIVYGSNGTIFTDVTDLMLAKDPTLTGAATFGTTLNSVTTTEFATLDGITSSTSELNILTGVTASASELNLLTSRTLASIDDVIDNFPAGTSMLFYQTAAPTGWTRITTAALNDHALRVVTSGLWTDGTQGTSPFSTVFGKTATDGHQLTIAEMPSHRHTIFNNQGVSGGAGNGVSNAGTGQFTGFAGGDGAHAHNIELRVKYLDMILASKD